MEFWHANLRKFVDTWTSTGPRSALRDATDMFCSPVYRHINRSFDIKRNVNTSGSIPLADLTLVDESFDRSQDKRKYEPTSVVTLRRMISVLPADLSDFVFVDIGSGKGRALFVASEYNFKRIIGVEFSRELHSIAKENLSSYENKKQKCFNIDLILDDARNLVAPEDSSVFFLYNPFLGAEDVLSHVLNIIEESFAANPRKMYFLYLNPRHSNLFSDLPFVRPIESRRLALRRAIIYESID